MSARLSQSYLARSVFRPGRSRGSGPRVLLFTLESALGVVAVVLVAGLAHWSSGLLPVAVLLYLMIVVPTALLCGFWQAVIVSLSAVVAQSWFTIRQPQLSLAAALADSITLAVFLLVALTVSRLSAGVTTHAREAELQVEQMHDLYEFTRRTLQIESSHGTGTATCRTGARDLRS